MDREVVVIGAGFSGIGAAIALKRAGFDDFEILEQAAELGGCWRDNTYPGVAVDVTSFSYSFSFAQNPRWSRLFAHGREIRQYAERCADQYGLRERMRFDTRVVRASFDEAAGLWRLDTSAGSTTARYLISACGVLTQPKLPEIEGLHAFEGQLMHTARWDHGYELGGRRVAVIGTGASAVQLVPAIAGQVARLHVFQRTPPWVLPRPDREIPPWMRELFRALPPAQAGLRLASGALAELVTAMGVVCRRPLPGLVRRIEALCLRHLERQVADPELRERLTPRYPFGCKRPCASSDYYPALARDNVELVTRPIERVTPAGICTADGEIRALDALILATGFKLFERGSMPPFEVYGRDGLELGRFWFERRYQAYEGATVPAFPNLFLVSGPYSIAGSSWFSMVEAQTTHVVRCLSEARRRRATQVEIRPEPHDAFFRETLRRQRNGVLFRNDCSAANSYYFDRHGDAPFLRPASGLELWWRSRHFDLDHYRFS